MTTAVAGRFAPLPTRTHATAGAFTSAQISIPPPALTCFARGTQGSSQMAIDERTLKSPFQGVWPSSGFLTHQRSTNTASDGLEALLSANLRTGPPIRDLRVRAAGHSAGDHNRGDADAR
jgi:hypothetical protein